MEHVSFTASSNWSLVITWQQHCALIGRCRTKNHKACLSIGCKCVALHAHWLLSYSRLQLHSHTLHTTSRDPSCLYVTFSYSTVRLCTYVLCLLCSKWPSNYVAILPLFYKLTATFQTPHSFVFRNVKVSSWFLALPLSRICLMYALVLGNIII